MTPQSELGKSIDDLTREYDKLKKEKAEHDFSGTLGAGAMDYVKRYTNLMNNLEALGIQVEALLQEDDMSDGPKTNNNSEPDDRWKMSVHSIYQEMDNYQHNITTKLGKEISDKLEEGIYTTSEVSFRPELGSIICKITHPTENGEYIEELRGFPGDLNCRIGTRDYAVRIFGDGYTCDISLVKKAFGCRKIRFDFNVLLKENYPIARNGPYVIFLQKRGKTLLVRPEIT